MSAGEIGGQALRLGLVDQIVVNLVPVVFSFMLDNASQVVRGDRVTHLVYDVRK